MTAWDPDEHHTAAGCRLTIAAPCPINALDAMASRITVLDLDGLVVMGNRAWWAHQVAIGAAIGLGERYTMAADVQGGVDPAHVAAVEELLRDVLAGRRVQADVDYRVTGSGVPRWYNVEVVPQRDEGELAGAVVTHSDITLRKRAEADLANLAMSDALTGLPKRAQMHDAIEALLDGPDGPGRVAVVLVDLDGFKLVNDSMGHIAGDLLLLAVSQRLTDALADGELLSRLASDEFAVMCPGPVDADGAVAVARRLTETLAAPFQILAAELSVTASVGVALDAGAEASAADLLGGADAAVHLAKERGCGRIELADERLRRYATRTLHTTTALHQALKRGQLRLHYQPVVELGSGRILGAEALLRWVHPDRGLLTAADFIDVVEGTGLIVPVGRWVLRHVCQHLRTWQVEHPQMPVTIAFNLSPRQLADSALVASIEAAVAESGCDPTGLIVEITEGMLCDDAGASAATFERITDLGAQLSIDDFGTGYSSLKRLQQMTVHGIKIDRSFVAGISAQGRDRVIVEATISLARALGIRVIAEGVETAEQARHLADTGAEDAQGWLWSNAVSPEEFGALLRTGARLPQRAQRASPAVGPVADRR